MSSHPDAEAFIRAALAVPGDRLTRLVFADWLDDTGQPANSAWAKYLRARAAASDAASPIDRDLANAEADSAAPSVTARLTLPAVAFAPRFLDLLDLLPAANFTLVLDGFDPPRHFFRGPAQAFFQTARGVPLASDRDRLLVAAARPHTAGIRESFEHQFGAARVVLVDAAAAQVEAAIDRGYTTPPHAVERPPAPPPTPRGPTVADRLQNTSAIGMRVCLEHILAEARAEGAGAVEVVAAHEAEYVVRYRVRGRTGERYRVPPAVGAELVRVAWAVSPDRLGAEVRQRNTSFGEGVFLNLQVRGRGRAG